MTSHPHKRHFFIDIAVAFLAGAGCVAAWEPIASPFIAIFSYSILFFLLLNRRTSFQAGLISLSFAIGLHAFGHGWVFDSLLNQAHTGLVFALIGASIFIVYLATFTIAPSIIFVWCINRSLRTQSETDMRKPRELKAYWISSYMFAALMTLGEFARSLFFNGFTSLSLGYAFVSSSAKGWIPVLGVYSVSFLVLSVAASAALVFCKPKFLSSKAVLLSAFVSIVTTTVGSLVFQSVQWVRPEGAPVSFRLIQGNVQQQNKFNDSKLDEQITRYVETITSRPATLIVTPETALPLYASQLPVDVWQRLSAFSSGTLSHIFLGIATLASNSDGYNSIFHIAPNQRQAARYDKATLMPFGEYSPAGFAWFTRRLSISLKDLSPGSANQAPFSVQYSSASNSALKVGSLICHEDLRGQDLRHWLPQVHFLLNPSNLSWFDGSIALRQRIQIVQARALEAGRPILRVANTGITAHIDHLGNVLSQLPLQHTGELSGLVQGYAGLTPYARYGDSPILIFLLALISFSVITLRVTKTSNSS